MKRVSKRFGITPTIAKAKKMGLDFSVEYKDIDELKDINSLKTSRVKGAKNYQISERSILAKQVTRLAQNVKRRFKRVSKRFGTTPAIAKAEEMGLDFSVAYKDISELKAMMRDLKYINSLKTSRVKGAKNYQKFDELVGTFGEDQKKKFFELYNKFVEENLLLSKYKYEVYEVIQEQMIGDASDAEIREAVNNLYDKLSEEEKPIDLEDKITF